MKKTAAALVLALGLAFAPATTSAQEATGFDPLPFIGQGNAFNCDAFASQAEAQAVLRADPTDPNKLDTDRPFPDGIACESNSAPFDLVAVPR
jgi:hypothetical protein